MQTQAHIKYNEYLLASLQQAAAAANSNSSAAVSSAIPVLPSQTQTSSQLNPNLIKMYEKWQSDYRDFRSIIAAFINGVNFMESQRFDFFVK